MRVELMACVALAMAGGARAQGEHYVRGYTRADGTYVAPHMQTNPNGTRADNWSTQGNVNPYTGQPGTRPLYPSAPAPSYSYQPEPPPAYRPAPPYGSSFNQPAPDSSFGPNDQPQ